MFIIYNGKSYQNVMKTGGTPSFQNGKLQIWKHVAKIFSATSLLQGAEDCAHRLLQPLSRDWINVLELYAFVPGRVAICCNTQSLFHATNLVSPFQPTLQPTSVAKRRRQKHVDQVLKSRPLLKLVSKPFKRHLV